MRLGLVGAVSKERMPVDEGWSRLGRPERI